MKELDPNSMTKIQVGAFLECIDLVRNGYMQRFAIYQSNFWFVKYRHLSNGRELIVKWVPDYYTISERGQIIKQCPAPAR